MLQLPPTLSLHTNTLATRIRTIVNTHSIPQVELDKPEEPVVLQLPPAEALRQRGPLLQLRDVTVAYGGKQVGARAPG